MWLTWLVPFIPCDGCHVTNPRCGLAQAEDFDEEEAEQLEMDNEAEEELYDNVRAPQPAVLSREGMGDRCVQDQIPACTTFSINHMAPFFYFCALAASSIAFHTTLL